MQKDNPYKVPENYFDNLGEQVQEKIKLEENQFEQVEEKRPLIVQLKPYMWMVASVFVFVFAARVILSVSIPSEYKIASFGSEEIPVNTQISSVDAETDEVDAQFFEDLMDATSDDIIDYLSDSDIDTDILLANL